MKKILFIAAALSSLVSCKDYSDCSGDPMYKEHNFVITSVTNRTFLGYDGWNKSECNKCGLEMMVNSSLNCKSHYGSVVLIKAPETNDFTDLCVQYYDLDTHKEYIKPISYNDIER